MRLKHFYIVIVMILSACTGAWDTYPSSQDMAVIPLSTIQAGEIASVSVFGEGDLSDDYTVDANGTITMPLIGDVMVLGLTPAQASDAIESALKDGGYLVSPSVTVSITKNRSFAAMGEVLNTGAYEYKEGMTVLDAVARAGGFTYRANQTKFDIVRKMPNGGEDVIAAVLSTRIFPGDVIRVRERLF